VKQAAGPKIQSIQRNILDFLVRYHPGIDLEDRAEKFVRQFADYLLPHSKILDIGGGWGFYHEPLRCRGHHHVVLDVIKPGVQKCPVVLYDGDQIPFEDESFDASLLITTLHHMSDPERVIREAVRVTRRTVIVIEDLYHHGPGKVWTKLRDQFFNVEFFGHAGQFKRKAEWQRIFESQGLHLIEEKEMYTWLSGLRILNGLLIFQKG